VPIRYYKASHCVNMAGQSHHELTLSKVPELDCSIVRPRNEESVLRVDGKAADLSSVATDDSLEFPRSVPLRLGNFTPSQ